MSYPGERELDHFEWIPGLAIEGFHLRTDGDRNSYEWDRIHPLVVCYTDLKFAVLAPERNKELGVQRVVWATYTRNARHHPVEAFRISELSSGVFNLDSPSLTIEDWVRAYRMRDDLIAVRTVNQHVPSGDVFRKMITLRVVNDRLVIASNTPYTSPGETNTRFLYHHGGLSIAGPYRAHLAWADRDQAHQVLRTALVSDTGNISLTSRVLWKHNHPDDSFGRDGPSSSHRSSGLQVIAANENESYAVHHGQHLYARYRRARSYLVRLYKNNGVWTASRDGLPFGTGPSTQIPFNRSIGNQDMAPGGLLTAAISLVGRTTGSHLSGRFYHTRVSWDGLNKLDVSRESHRYGGAGWRISRSQSRPYIRYKDIDSYSHNPSHVVMQASLGSWLDTFSFTTEGFPYNFDSNFSTNRINNYGNEFLRFRTSSLELDSRRSLHYWRYGIDTFDERYGVTAQRAALPSTGDYRLKIFIHRLYLPPPPERITQRDDKMRGSAGRISRATASGGSAATSIQGKPDRIRYGDSYV